MINPQLSDDKPGNPPLSFRFHMTTSSDDDVANVTIYSQEKLSTALRIGRLLTVGEPLPRLQLKMWITILAQSTLLVASTDTVS